MKPPNTAGRSVRNSAGTPLVLAHSAKLRAKGCARFWAGEMDDFYKKTLKMHYLLDVQNITFIIYIFQRYIVYAHVFTSKMHK